MSAADGNNGTSRPMLSKIKQRLAEKKERDRQERFTSPTSPPLSSPPSEPESSIFTATPVGDGMSTVSRLSEIKKRLKKDPQAEESAGSKSPATLPRAKDHRASSVADELLVRAPVPPPRPPKATQTPPLAAVPAVTTEDDLAPPPLPTRTKEMLEMRAPPKPLGKPQNYSNVTLDGAEGTQSKAEAPSKPAVAERKKNTAPDSEDKKKKSFFGRKPTSPIKSFLKPPRSPRRSKTFQEKPSRDQEEVASRANFLNMKIRPLPPPPTRYARETGNPDHTSDDYEKFDPALDTVSDRDIPIFRPSAASSDEPAQLPGTPVKRWHSLSVQDAHHVPPLPSQRPVPPPKNVPDYIDGYVNSDGLIADIQYGNIDSRPPAQTPTVHEPEPEPEPYGKEGDEEEGDDDRDYDYPNLNGSGIFRSEAAKKRWMKKVERRIRDGRVDASLLFSGARDRINGLRCEDDAFSRSRTASNASSDYVPMASNAMDDSYINYLSMQSQGSVDSSLPPRNLTSNSHPTPPPNNDWPPQTGKHYASDDIDIYMNLPVPVRKVESSLPPRDKPRAPYSPNTLPRQSPSVSRPPPVTIKPHQPPPVATKPPKPRANTPSSSSAGEPSATVEHASLTSSQVSGVQEDDTPSQGWGSPISQPLSEVEMEPDYQNFDVTQSLPASSTVPPRPAGSRRTTAPEIETRRTTAPGQSAGLPPRNIPRQIKN